jgi:RimJ/RimL family protein N-acetyltransferase
VTADRSDAGTGHEAVTIRMATVADLDGLCRLYASLSEDDVRRRFFTPHLPGRDFFESWLRLPEIGGLVLVAVAEPGGQATIVGEAGYAPLPDGDAEFAIAVAPGWRGGLGRSLLGALLEAAAAHGVPNLEAEILTENRAMLGVVRHCRWATIDNDDFSVLRVTIGAAASTPGWPPRRAGRRLLVEVPGGRWSGTAAARAAGYDVIACPGPPHDSTPGSASGCPLLRGEHCPLVDGADAIVVALPADDPTTAEIVAGQRRTAPEVPVVLSSSPAADLGVLEEVREWS